MREFINCEVLGRTAVVRERLRGDGPSEPLVFPLPPGQVGWANSRDALGEEVCQSKTLFSHNFNHYVTLFSLVPLGKGILGMFN